MRKIIFLVLVFTTSSAFSLTRSNFIGMQMLINIASTNYDGTIDGSPQKLYAELNVPEQGSVMGPGKSLDVSPEKILNFVCGKRGENNYQCSIIIHRSSYAQFQPGKAYIEFKGEMAKTVFDQFYSNGTEYSFRDESGLLLIYSSPSRFVIKFDAQGI